MKYPVTITYKNEELILTVKKKDFAKILVDIYVQLSEKAVSFNPPTFITPIVLPAIIN